MRFLGIIVAFLSLAISLNAQENVNPYGLDITATTAAYQREIGENDLMELIDLGDYIPHLAFDIRYAGTNNFTGLQVYTSGRAFLRKAVAEALAKAEAELNSMGLGLKIYDAYRPYAATLKFYALVKNTDFVAAPWVGSRHNRGAAVDVTLIDLQTGDELLMPTAYDDFTEKANPACTALPEEAIQNRDLLVGVMRKHGFTVFQTEWWHFDFRGWEQYGLLDMPFDSIDYVRHTLSR